jgi:hypothetical protein
MTSILKADSDEDETKGDVKRSSKKSSKGKLLRI